MAELTPVGLGRDSSVHPVPMLLLFSPYEFFDPQRLGGTKTKLLRQFLPTDPAKLVPTAVDD